MIKGIDERDTIGLDSFVLRKYTGRLLDSALFKHEMNISYLELIKETVWGGI